VNGAAICVGDKLACFWKEKTSIRSPAAFVITVKFFCLLVLLFISFIEVTHWRDTPAIERKCVLFLFVNNEMEEGK